MNRQLTILELSIMVMMGAILAVPLQSPDRGLLPAVVIAVVVVGIGRLIV